MGKCALDTLAQLDTGQGTDPDFVLDKGTGTGERRRLQKRAQSKYLTYALIFRLVDLESPLKKSYWNTYYCCNTLIKKGDTVTGKYCKNRWCSVCNRIRTAQIMKSYLPVVEDWGSKYFVTLTVPNVKGEVLREELERMGKELLRIRKKFRKAGIPFVGVRKLECTYNPERNDYHPHYHFIIKDEEAARELLREWLRRFPEARSWCQDVREADDGSVKEMFKYFTKIISKPVEGEGSVGTRRRGVYPLALDVIFQAVSGIRTYQNFGFKLPKVAEEVSEEVEAAAEAVAEEALYQWEQEVSDWVEVESGELLSGYEPVEGYRELVEGIWKKKSSNSNIGHVEHRCRGDDG